VQELGTFADEAALVAEEHEAVLAVAAEHEDVLAVAAEREDVLAVAAEREDVLAVAALAAVVNELLAIGAAKLPDLPEYADDTAAGVGELEAGDLYRTATGVVMVKL